MKLKKIILFLLITVMIFADGCKANAEEVIRTYQGDTDSAVSSVPESLAAESDTGSVTDKSLPVTSEPPEKICIYICGAVNTPGVYELPSGARIFDAIEKAGGLTPEADLKKVNQASLLTDGQQITVLTREETANGVTAVASDDGTASEATETATVNINTADEKTLMTLSGIGETKAAAIIDYRTTNGAFKTIAEITKVPGIGDGLFSRIKDRITVG